MATQKEKTVEPKTTVKTDASRYTVKELAESGIFGSYSDGVAAAMRYAGKTSATVEEAKKLTETFLKREVK